MVNLIRGCRLAVLTGGRVLRRGAAAVERREWGKVDRSDSDLSGRVESASGDTGAAVPDGGAGAHNEPVSGARSEIRNSDRILVRLARDSEADFTAAFRPRQGRPQENHFPRHSVFPAQGTRPFRKGGPAAGPARVAARDAQ